jgi:hypothetical protein
MFSPYGPSEPPECSNTHLPAHDAAAFESVWFHTRAVALCCARMMLCAVRYAFSSAAVMTVAALGVASANAARERTASVRNMTIRTRDRGVVTRAEEVREMLQELTKTVRSRALYSRLHTLDHAEHHTRRIGSPAATPMREAVGTTGWKGWDGDVPSLSLFSTVVAMTVPRYFITTPAWAPQTLDPWPSPAADSKAERLREGLLCCWPRPVARPGAAAELFEC